MSKNKTISRKQNETCLRHSASQSDVWISMLLQLEAKCSCSYIISQITSNINSFEDIKSLWVLKCLISRRVTTDDAYLVPTNMHTFRAGSDMTFSVGVKLNHYNHNMLKCRGGQ